MNPRRPGSPASRTPSLATADVHRFGDVASPPSPLLFLCSGQRRDEHAVRAAAIRAEEDARTLRRLARSGIDARQARGSTVTAVDLATLGAMAGETTPEVRRIAVFHSVSRREQREAEHDLRSYLDSMSDVGRHARRLVHVRLRPRDPSDALVAVDGLRGAHRRATALLARRLDYARQLSGGLVASLATGVHHRPICWPGNIVDLHFHIVFDTVDGADLDRVLAYLRRHYDTWEGEPRLAEDAAEGGEESIVGYLRNSGARHVSAFGDQQLAEYVRQVAGLHRYRTLGPLRNYIGRKRAERVAIVYHPRRQNAVPGTVPSGPTILRTTTAWIGLERRPCILVRGWTGDWSDLEARYDLDLAITAARHALDPAPSSFTADTPESPSSPRKPPPDPGPPPRPKVVRDYLADWTEDDFPF